MIGDSLLFERGRDRTFTEWVGNKTCQQWLRSDAKYSVFFQLPKKLRIIAFAF